ncbi:DUF7534 family protein [Haloferax larsenii]|uniref:Uncharacterized protein n=1 Tax=Haloferax larsenii TaxID=302484 RepID=A0A1H7FKL4_HALLR|nr:hypothetical protein [Haloferax larsenii]SEK26508.1 hypothetical protein SAMN04488691_10147 [Haloferax larsenii]
MGHFRAFLVTLLALDAVVFVVGSVFAPPDPVTQLLLVGPALLLAPAIAWWLVYRDGFARLQGAVDPDEE